MRKIWFLFMLVPALAFASSYPDVTAPVVLSATFPAAYDPQELQLFTEEWHEDAAESGQGRPANGTIGQLESLYRIQTIQLEQLQRQGRPTFSLLSDPANPLYGLSRVIVPILGVDQTTLTHKFGLGLGISQLLPTAGSLDLSLRHGVTVSSSDGGAWEWKQNPSASLSLRQPLAIGDSLFDTDYASKKLQRQQLVQEGAAEAVRLTSGQVDIQSMRLRGTLQALLESRWIALRQAKISDDALSDARKDLGLGIISRNQLVAQEQALLQQQLRIKDLERELDSVRHSLERLLGQEVSLQENGSGLIDLEAISWLGRFQGGLLVDDPAVLAAALAQDADHQAAGRDMMVARLDRSLGNPADAPTLSLSMNISPYYDPSAGNGLWGSFDELFTTGEPVFSVSVAFQSNDLARNTGRTTRSLADEKLVQASIAKEEAASAVRQRSRDLQMRIETGLSTIGLLLDEYRFAVNAIEIERILAESYQGSTLSMERVELARYSAAFTLLQHLRTMTVLAMELRQFMGSD